MHAGYVLYRALVTDFILVGDFNINYFCTQSPLFSKLSSVTSSFNLIQVVTKPTRISDHTCMLIDLVFVSSPSVTQVISCETVPALANSDHYGLQIIFPYTLPKDITLDISKSSGPDNITPRMLKSTANSIAPSLTNLFNLSLTTGT